jgi:hypothetical protein
MSTQVSAAKTNPNRGANLGRTLVTIKFVSKRQIEKAV